MNDEEKRKIAMRGFELSSNLDIGKLVEEGAFKVKDGIFQIGDPATLPESLRSYIDDYLKAHDIDPSHFRGQPIGVPIKFSKEAFEELKEKLDIGTEES